MRTSATRRLGVACRDVRQVRASQMQWRGWARRIGTHLRGRCKRFSLLPAVPGSARTRRISSVVLICRKTASPKGIKITARQISSSVLIAPADEQMLEKRNKAPRGFVSCPAASKNLRFLVLFLEKEHALETL